jgi:hypothetical protein
MCEQAALEAMAALEQAESALLIAENRAAVLRMMVQTALGQLNQQLAVNAALERTNTSLRDSLRATYERMMS